MTPLNKELFQRLAMDIYSDKLESYLDWVKQQGKLDDEDFILNGRNIGQWDYEQGPMGLLSMDEFMKFRKKLEKYLQDRKKTGTDASSVVLGKATGEWDVILRYDQIRKRFEIESIQNKSGYFNILFREKYGPAKDVFENKVEEYGSKIVKEPPEEYQVNDGLGGDSSTQELETVKPNIWKHVFYSLAADIEGEKPFDVEIGKGPPRKPRVEKPEVIEDATEDLKQTRDRLMEMKTKMEDLKAQINETLQRAAEAVSPKRKELAEIQSKFQQEGQKLAKVLQDQEETWRRMDKDLLVVIDKVQKKKLPLTSEDKIKAFLNAAQRLGYDTEKLEQEMKKSLNAMTRYKDEIIKRVYIYPEKRPPTAKAVKQANIIQKIVSFFTGLWNIISAPFTRSKKVAEDIEELKQIVGE